MLDGPLITAEQFLEIRHELPENGQWAELEAGQVTNFQPPDLDHGNTVLNLSKAFADFIQTTELGYACFDLGMLMESMPDTVRFPAASYFLSGPRFEETDKPYTKKLPDLVIELASTPDRLKNLSRRIEDYLAWGVEGVWTIDPKEQTVTVVSRREGEILLEKADSVEHQSLLPGFLCPVENLFQEPGWWAG